MNPLTYRDGLSIEGWRALLSLVIYGFCSNKTLYSASPSFPMFIGSAAPARRVLQIGSGHPSLCPDVFLQLDNYFFRNFDVVQETQITLCVKEPIFFKKTSFAPNTVKMGQIWAKNKIFFELIFLNYLIFTEFVL